MSRNPSILPVPTPEAHTAPRITIEHIRALRRRWVQYFLHADDSPATRARLRICWRAIGEIAHRVEGADR